MHSYFASLEESQRLLSAHGFSHWPTDDELARYVFEIMDMITLLASADGIRIYRDARGRLCAERVKGVR